MKKTISTILCSACAMVVFGASVGIADSASHALRRAPLSPGAPSLTPLKSPVQMEAGEVTRYVLIDEHFDGLREGSGDNPSGVPLMSQADYYAGRGISQNLIGGGSWTAVNAYSAGGAVALVSPNINNSGYINTPVGDYSGEVTVSFRAKPIENNGQKKSYVFIQPFYGDFRSPSDARCEAITDMSFNLYAGDENWTEVEIKFNNYSSNNDGYISISCDLGSAVLIDDLKITTSPAFVADPVLEQAEFGVNTLTAHWQPVRRAFNYNFRLYKKSAAGDGDAEYEEDFDDILQDGSNLPEGWTFNVKELCISENGGYDGTPGIILKNGETLETLRNGAKYRNASVWLQSYYPDQDAADADTDGMVCIDVCKDGKWYPFAGYYMGVLYNDPAEDDMLTLAEMYLTEFADRYESIRIRVKDSNCPEAYVVADHFYIETGQPLSYELIPDKDGYDYWLVEGDSFEIKFGNNDKDYPYHGLKQECDYAYSLQSHYLFERSKEVFADLEGVYMPAVNKPEETSDGFKASWEPVYAASSYRVDNYGVRSLKNNTAGCVVFEEKFDKTECPTTSPLYPEEMGNTEFADLSDYSDFPGWGGLNNVYVEGMMGFYGGRLVTPLIHLPNAENAFVKIVYYATPGDVLTMTDADGRRYYHECTGASDMNRTEAVFNIPAGTKPCEFTLRSEYRLPILIDEFTVSQDAKAGNKIYTYLGSTFEDAPATETSFEGLKDTGFTGFACSVTAIRSGESGLLFSSPSNFRFAGAPEMFEGTSEVKAPAADVTVQVEGYYSIDGIRHASAVKGINIVRMTDGTVRKIFVR